MGSSSAKPVVQNSLELYGKNFAKKYIEYVLKYDVSNIGFISKAYHLLVFLAEDGASKMYDSNVQQLLFAGKCSPHWSLCFTYATMFVPSDREYWTIKHHIIQDLITFICAIILNKSLEANNLFDEDTTVNFNVDCYQLNKYVKQHATTILATQQQDQRDFSPENLQKHKDEIAQITENMKRNEDRIRDTKQIHATIQQVIDENIGLNKRRMVLMDIVKNSEKPENAIEVINKNIEKLQLLIRILVCEDMVEQQVVFPVVPTHVPIVYPSVPETPVATVAYASESAKDVPIATANVCV